MVFDSPMQRLGRKDNVTPMQIAHHPLFTAREKIDLLNTLKAEATGIALDEDELGFSPEDIDEAIEEVRIGVQNGQGAETVLRGDN
jgi:hypothetical protein